MKRRTISIIVIRKIGAICRTWCKGTPESTSILPFLQAGQINMTPHSTFFERFGKVIIVDLIVIDKSYQYRQVNMAI